MKALITRTAKFFSNMPSQAQFAIFLGVTVLIALALTVLSYSLYLINGTAQLDLSRPGYKQALSEVSPSDDNNFDYSSTGTLDAKALQEFKTKFDSLTAKTKGYGAFDPNALSDEQLNLTESSVIGPQ